MGRLRYIRLTRRQRVRVWLAIILLALTALLAAILLHLRPMLEIWQQPGAPILSAASWWRR